MKLHVISSSSAGNAYLLKASTGETLVLECGVSISALKRALDFDLSKVVGVLVSHEHGDHCRAAKDVIACGLTIYASQGTLECLDNRFGRRSVILKEGKTINIGSFRVKPFGALHDCKEPLNFLIEHPECGRVVFITDTIFCEYTFPGLNNILIEANYSQEILDRKVRAGESAEFLRNRVLQSHMSLDTCKEFLLANDLKRVNNIVLIHLSDSNSDAAQFKKEVQELTGKEVAIARPGIEIDFNQTPF